MKYIILLSISATPLVMLAITAGLNVASISGAASSRATAAEIIEKAKTGSSADLQVGQEEAVVLKPFLIVELMQTTDLQFDAVAAPAEQLIRKQWATAYAARKLLDSYVDLASDLEILSPGPATTALLTTAESSLKKLQSFALRRAAFGEVIGSVEVFDAVDRSVSTLQAKVTTIKQSLELASAKNATRQALESGKYRECLALLDTPPLSQISDDSEIGVMRMRAEFHLAALELLQKAPPSGQLSTLHDELSQFLQTHKKPPSAAEVVLLAKLEERRQSIAKDMAIYEISRRPTLDGVLTQAETVLRDFAPDDATRARVRQHVVTWLKDTAFATLQGKLEAPKDLFGKQEVELKNVQRRFGLFFLPPGTEQYRYWVSQASRQALPKGDEQINRTAIVSEPSTPKYIQWADRYNTALNDVLQNVERKDVWERFAAECRTLQTEFEAYQNKWGKKEFNWDESCAAWNFLQRSQTADEVLKQWARFAAVAQ